MLQGTPERTAEEAGVLGDARMWRPKLMVQACPGVTWQTETQELTTVSASDKQAESSFDGQVSGAGVC